jgi:hypothetical protein
MPGTGAHRGIGVLRASAGGGGSSGADPRDDGARGTFGDESRRGGSPAWTCADPGGGVGALGSASGDGCAIRDCEIRAPSGSTCVVAVESPPCSS